MNRSCLPSARRPLPVPVRVHVSLLLVAACASGFAAEPLPVSAAYWKDPSFLKSFNGSYRIEARIEPNVSSEERALLVEIQNLMAAEKRGAALEKLASSPLTATSAALTFNLGNLHFESGDIGKAVVAYESAIKEYPSFRRAHRNLALARMRANEVEKALVSLTEAIRLGDADGSTYGLLGYCRLAREEYASALQAYRLAQLTEPDVAEWKAGIAQCLQELDQKKEAVALLDEVIRQRPLEASYSILKANLHLDLDQPDLAVKALELPFRLKLLPPDSMLTLADLHLRAGRQAAAQAAVNAAFSKPQERPGNPAILRLVRTASAEADWPLVKDLLAKAESAQPDRSLQIAKARYLLASREDVGAGLKLLEALTREDPTDGEALLALGKHLASAGQPESAELTLERASADPQTAYESQVELTRLHVALGRYKEALASLDAARALQDSDALREYRLALQSTLSASQ